LGSYFSAFLAFPANIETVKLGDEPRNFFTEPREFFNFKEHAAARLYFTNHNKKHFVIRLGRINSPTNYTVIGAGWD
jgi:hypothetical protein